jgi:hypothetical protein
LLTKLITARDEGKARDEGTGDEGQGTRDKGYSRGGLIFKVSL